jgi:hypothetical protein
MFQAVSGFAVGYQLRFAGFIPYSNKRQKLRAYPFGYYALIFLYFV